jgi:hypothetical protein
LGIICGLKDEEYVIIKQKFMSNIYKNTLLISLLVLVVFGLGFLSASKVEAQEASSYRLRGVGWTAQDGSSSPVGVGWIKFSSSSESGSSSSYDYGVYIDSEGNLSGQAWAGPYYGWLSFNNTGARMDMNTGELSGWAQFYNAKGNWDGKVHLRGSNPDYGVKMDLETKKFSGEAWGGGTIVGWIVFGGSECPNCTVRAEETTVVPVVEPKYNLSCETQSESEIDVSWAGEELDDYSFELWGGEAGSLSKIYDIPSPGGYGDYAHSDLSSETEYEYELRIFNEEEERDGSVEPASQPISCVTTDSPPPPPPDDGGITGEEITVSGLDVYPLSSHELHLTWKDDVVDPHNFVLERIKLTPDDPELTKVESINGNDGKLNVYWENKTNISNEVSSEAGNNIAQRGPFYNVIERTKEGSFDGREYEEGVVDAGSTKTDFSISDTGLDEATVYSYRVKSCSYGKVDVTRDGINNPEDICTGYSSTRSGATAPADPTNLSVRNSGGNVIVSWNDNSSGESGYQIRRNGSLINTIGSQSGTDRVNYVDRNVPGGTYEYKVRAFKTHGSNVYSNYSNERSITTEVELEVTVGGGGTVTSDPSGIDCPGDCSSMFSFRTRVWLTAATSSPDYVFASWSGCDSVTEDDVCVLDMTTDKEVTAMFSSTESSFNGLKMMYAEVSQGFRNFAQLLPNVRGVFNNISSFVKKVFDKTAGSYEALAQSNIDFASYFSQFKKTLGLESNLGVYNDVGLEADTVYLYRLKAILESDGSVRYTVDGAGKTFPLGGETNRTVKMCTWNSRCEEVNGVNSGGEVLEPQCERNADCRDVGSSRKSFEEER